MLVSRSLVTASVLLVAASATAQTYRVVSLQPLPGTSQVILHDLNNALQVVGTSDGILVLWDRDVQPRRLPVTNVTTAQINNAGLISGTHAQGVSPVPGRLPPPARVFSIRDGTEYIDWPTLPISYFAQALELTDTGILLLFTLADAPSQALYQSRLYNLADAFIDISEDGMGGGSRYVRDDSGRTRLQGLLRWLDGRELVPWPEFARVSVVGPHGHFGGTVCTSFPPPERPVEDSCTVLHGSPGGPVMRRTFPGGIFAETRDINRAGDMVGYVTERGGRIVPFLFRGGVFHDLNTWANIPGQQVCTGHRLTADGVILAYVRPAGTVGSCQPALLIPSEPAAPTGLAHTRNGRIVTLRWQAVSGATDYTVEAGSSPGRSDLFNGAGGAGLSISATVPPGRYFVRVRARNAVGVSSPSNEVIIDVP